MLGPLDGGFAAPAVTNAYYTSSETRGLETATVAADGMSGVVRFDAPAQPSSASRGQLPDRIAGTFEWTCPGW